MHGFAGYPHARPGDDIPAGIPAIAAGDGPAFGWGTGPWVEVYHHEGAGGLFLGFLGGEGLPDGRAYAPVAWVPAGRLGTAGALDRAFLATQHGHRPWDDGLPPVLALGRGAAPRR